MNPHNPTERPGAYLVARRLGVTDAGALPVLHPHGSRLRPVAEAVNDLAGKADELNAKLFDRVRSTLGTLEDLTRHDGAQPAPTYDRLRDSSIRVDLLALQCHNAYAHLGRQLDTYQEALRTVHRHAGEWMLSAAHDDPEQRGDTWGTAPNQKHEALLTIERGGFRFHEHPGAGNLSLRNDSDIRHYLRHETVEWLQEEQLVTTDTAFSTYEGQPISLTDRGRATVQAVGAVQNLVAATPVAGPATRSADLGLPPSPQRAADLPSPAQQRALEEIARGKVRLQQTSVAMGIVVDAASRAHITYSTVQAMDRRGWVHQDVRTSLFVGQELSITPDGEVALRAAQKASSRVSAALHRSSPAADPTPLAPLAPGPATRPSVHSRTR
ncbi:hypothetical protein OG455_38070 [Kitasatospora sp. NBC_01287]|uniref:hypothetical protein n=1 Tax=Kitasatospora sp. NBC_01287 TaxID=2903573 RepID=UPI002253A2A7|nr:hypothetical protein [Kitasatospora sp. NBC_01287]MCX4751245.1 hypothetical protein [Kitasatospora sp. NBC_01287]